MSPSEALEAVAAIEEALALGLKEVDYAGRHTTYQSVSDMLRALEYFKRVAQGTPASGPAPSAMDRGSYAAFERD